MRELKKEELKKVSGGDQMTKDWGHMVGDYVGWATKHPGSLAFGLIPSVVIYNMTT